MLSNYQIEDLAQRMNIPLAFVGFKDQLKDERLEYNKSYVINLDDEFDEDGKRNEGSHWTCFQVNKLENKIQGIYFDSYGIKYPEIVKEFVGKDIPYNTKDIQSAMGNACGFFCLAFLHYINTYENRVRDLYDDTEDFLDLFVDLNISVDWKQNEYMLKMFFQSSDVEKRKPIEVFYNVNNIIN
jgi:hypothetical protein